jgi:DNA-directed RNA polymerase subunit E'/Rpb7
MAYNADYLCLIANVGGKVGFKDWLYDTADATATVDTAGYISDAKARRMEKGDRVYVRIWTTAVPAASSEKLTAAGTANILISSGFHWVIGVDATTGAADLTNTLALTATNTD